MLADLTAMQLYCLQIGRLAQAGHLTPTVAGLAKMHNTGKARAIAAEARDMLGGNGILLDYQVMRHMVDLEAIHTFEGTETMQTRIVARAIPGIGAFTYPATGTTCRSGKFRIISQNGSWCLLPVQPCARFSRRRCREASTSASAAARSAQPAPSTLLPGSSSL